MNTNTYRVRFASSTAAQDTNSALNTAARHPGPSLEISLPTQQPPPKRQRNKSKSRRGCKECKARRVKCDETFPVCLRCQRRGSVCHLDAPPTTQWQIEIPWPLTEPWTGVVKPDKELLHYWLGNTSQMMTLTLDDNPLSFPLVEHLLYTPSLVHAVQSVSAGQEGFFGSTAVQTCLRERGLAIRALRLELRNHKLIKPASLLSVFLLGISSSWTEEKPVCYGKEHLSGARTLLAKALIDERRRYDPVIQYILGWYLYWDMTCAFVEEPEDYDASLMKEAEIVTAIERSRTSFHSMIGFSAKLFYNLASVGRYCRRVLQTGISDPDVEAMLERELLSWNLEHGHETLIDMSFAYRNHGLIMLYEVCCRRHPPEKDVDIKSGDHGISQAIRQLAMESLRTLLGTPIDAACINFHSMPLLTAGAQLRHDDTRMRVRVVDRFKALYSTNRIMVNIWAIELLEELWVLRDGGEVISWPELLLSKDWTLNFA